MPAYSKTGKTVNEITIDNVIKGNVVADDIKISSETLLHQAKVARENGREQLAQNFERAAELVNIPDDIMLDYYNKLRPNRANKSELLDIACTLENKYNAVKSAKLFKEAAEIYEKRNILVSK